MRPTLSAPQKIKRQCDNAPPRPPRSICRNPPTVYGSTFLGLESHGGGCDIHPITEGVMQQGTNCKRVEHQGPGTLRLHPRLVNTEPIELVRLRVSYQGGRYDLQLHKGVTTEKERGAAIHTLSQTLPGNGFTNVGCCEALVFTQGREERTSFEHKNTIPRDRNHILQNYTLFEREFEREKMKEKISELTQQNTAQPETLYESWEDSYHSYCIWPACLFLSMAFGKKSISGKACGSYFRPNDSRKGRISWCPAPNSLPVGTHVWT